MMTLLIAYIAIQRKQKRFQKMIYRVGGLLKKDFDSMSRWGGFFVKNEPGALAG
tara:strand:- start:385 stop:546 length:162 start_codon:yes stop_codon:yes gene_type:complete